MAGVRDLIVALPLVRPEDLPLPSNTAACAILTGSCPRKAFLLSDLGFWPCSPKTGVSGATGVLHPCTSGWGLPVSGTWSGSCENSPLWRGLGVLAAAPLLGITRLLYPHPSSSWGLTWSGETETDGQGSEAGPLSSAICLPWLRAWDLPRYSWGLGEGSRPTAGKLGRAGREPVGSGLSCLLGRLLGMGIWRGERGRGCPHRGACCELSALCLHSLPGDKKGSPPPAATAKSQFSLRRRQALRGKSGPGLKKTPPKGLMQAPRHRPCCVPPGRAHLPKEGRRTGQGFWGGGL